MGRGIGYIDAHLLAAALLADSVLLWTHDRRLRNVAVDLGIACEIAEFAELRGVDMPDTTNVILGFDPGGNGKFGWSICRDHPR